MRSLPAALFAAFLLSTSVATAHTIIVHPGESIQAAVNSAVPGDVIHVRSGVYHETGTTCTYDPSELCAVVIPIDNLTLQADIVSGRPVIVDGTNGPNSGITVGKPGSATNHCEVNSAYRTQRSRIIGFTVTNFSDTGIVMSCADNWELAYNTARNNQTYGLYTPKSGNGKAHHNLATGSHDTGIYVGQSHHVHVYDNVFYGNVSGFELENSYNSEVDHNTAFHNTGGILSFILPGLDVMVSHDNSIHDNWSHDNNAPNTCLHPGDDVCKVPPGTGMLLLAGNHNTVVNNTVTGNKSYGIALADFCTAFQVPPSQCSQIGFNPDPLNWRIAYNVSRQNNADLLWTGLGTGDCWIGNTAKVRVPAQLPRCAK